MTLAHPDAAPAHAEVPRVDEIAPGIWRFIGTRRSAHTYLLKGSRRVVLVDSGLPATTGYLEACLGTLGLAATDLDLVVLTHEHLDHAGGAPTFAAHCIVAAHPHAANKLHLADAFSLMSKAFDEVIAPFDVDLMLVEGSTVDLGGLTLEVIHTPGHCSGSICLLVPERALLISGDTIMAHGIVGGVLLSGNTSDYITSLQRLQRLRIERLLPGHGKISEHAADDLAQGILRLSGLLTDSQLLFSTLRETDLGFDDMMRSLRDLNVL